MVHQSTRRVRHYCVWCLGGCVCNCTHVYCVLLCMVLGWVRVQRYWRVLCTVVYGAWVGVCTTVFTCTALLCMLHGWVRVQLYSHVLCTVVYGAWVGGCVYNGIHVYCTVVYGAWVGACTTVFTCTALLCIVPGWVGECVCNCILHSFSFLTTTNIIILSRKLQASL